MKPTLIRPTALPASAATPVVTPLMPSVVYAADDPSALDAIYDGKDSGYVYAREGHPNADVLSRRIAVLEGLDDGVMVGSGMAAVTAVLLGLTQAGDHVIGGDQLYGRSLRMMSEDLPRLGIATSTVDTCDVQAVANAIRPETRLVLIEIVSNPTLRLADLDGIAALCREKGVLLVVDNTFTTPRAVQPILRGADVVLHSVTKLLAGHADVTLGWVGARDAALLDRMRVFTVTTGMTASPFDCWLAERGMMTFDMRFDRAQDTAGKLAEALAKADGVRRVIYPTRPDHPDAQRAQAVLQGQGGNMVSFELAGGRAAADGFVRAAKGVAFAPTLGDVGTTLSHPLSSSHRNVSAADQTAMGLSEGFFRVSVGLETPEDLIATFMDGIAAANGS